MVSIIKISRDTSTILMTELKLKANNQYINRMIEYKEKHLEKNSDYLNYHGRVYRLLHFDALTNDWEKNFLKTIYINNKSTSKQWKVVRRIEKKLNSFIEKYERQKEIENML